MTMTELFFVATAWIFVIALHLQDKMHRKERKDLLNRLMAKDTHDYKQLSNGEQPAKGERTTNFIKKQIKSSYQDYE